MIDETSFFQRLAKASSWRKKELLVLSTMGIPAGKEAQMTAMRSSVVLFCAHCEGFLRDSVRILLRAYEDAELRLCQLRHVYVILLCPDGVVRSWPQVRSSLLSRGEGVALDSKQLKRLMWILGMDYEWFSNREIPMADLRMLRNKIAHGERVAVSPEVYPSYPRWALGFIEDLEAEFSQFVSGRAYLKDR